MNKKSIVLILLIVLVFLVFGCNKKIIDDGDDPIIDNSLIEQVPAEDDPNHIDGLKYKINDEWKNNGDYYYAGLYEKDGSIHKMPSENQVKGKTINVLYFGAVANDPKADNTAAVKSAISSAKEGDEIYFPEGRWYFTTQSLANPVYAHINLKSGVNLRGAGSDKTFIVSNFSSLYNTGYSTCTIAMVSASNITISDICLTANATDDILPPTLSTTTANFPGREHVPTIGISAINTDNEEQSKNIVIKNCLVEYFQVAGISLRSTIDCTIKDTTVQKATDLSGGGHGYGVLISGSGHESFYAIDGNLDSRYNVVENVKIVGPYIRHGIILSYVTHNNLIYNCSIDGSQDEGYDLHGEDEFLNVFSKNIALNGASNCFGAGNAGATHDSTGAGNVLYGNDITSSKGGISIVYGTTYTFICKNNIHNLQDNATAININYGPNTIVKDNVISTVAGESYGIRVSYNYVWSNPEDGLSKVTINNNKIEKCKIGLQLNAYKTGSNFDNNTITNCETVKIDLNNEFVLPEPSDFFTLRSGQEYYPIQEGNINRGSWNDVVANLGYFWFKGSDAEPAFNRMIFYEWDIDKTQINNYTHAYIRLTFTSKSARQHVFFWGIENFEWDATKMTWGNAPFVNNIVNNSELEEDPTNLYNVDSYPYACKIYDPDKKLTFITDFEAVSASEEFLTYYIDITDYIKTLNSNNFTMILTNETMDGAYSSVRNMLGNTEDIWPSIIFSNK